MKFFRDNGLTIVLVIFSALTIGGMIVTGWFVFDHELTELGTSKVDSAIYALSGNFLSSLFENWELEFLKMSAYLMLTAFLFQRGSAESNDPDEPSEIDEDLSNKPSDTQAPWPARVGGWVGPCEQIRLVIDSHASHHRKQTRKSIAKVSSRS
ncbi:hypothetical protein ASG42_30115 [Rhizobium sp. Leaf391]|uniref:DUF6766 family protein n=1 Tax=Rhizobium sp. Leaf391 TaxID=1736360 RepID=UPI00071493C4|nr:DUF6766 family protein [Rhizobium sp. Leaf391]KQS95061.1 hypothetical protein ASG42_30115 [Rhizobium sp. Leaf391]